MLIKNTKALTNSNAVLTDIDIHIDNGIIDYIGKDYPHIDNCLYDGKDKLVVPGFYNTHCHVPMTLLRNLGGNRSLDKWLNEKIFPAESKLSEEYVYYGSLLGIAEMLQSGVVSFNDMYYYSQKICDSVCESGIMANIAMDGFAFNEKLNSKYAIGKNELYNFYNEYNNINSGQIKVDMCIHAQYTTNLKKATTLSEIAQHLGCNIQLHLSETEKENLNCYRDFNQSPTEFFYNLGVFDSPTTAAHCVYLNDNDLKLLKEKNVTISHCPISNLKLGSGIANLKKMIENNLNITIGTDGAASNDNLDFLSDLKTAILLQKGITKDSTFLSPKDMLKMATQNGANSQKRFDCGDIVIGNKADLFILDLNSINLQPTLDLHDALFYSALSQNILLTMVNGKVLYKDGEFTTIDIEKVKFNVKMMSQKIF